MVGFETTSKISVSSKEKMNQTVNKIVPKKRRVISEKVINNYRRAASLSKEIEVKKVEIKNYYE